MDRCLMNRFRFLTRHLKRTKKLSLQEWHLTPILKDQRNFKNTLINQNNKNKIELILQQVHIRLTRLSSLALIMQILIHQGISNNISKRCWYQGQKIIARYWLNQDMIKSRHKTPLLIGWSCDFFLSLLSFSFNNFHTKNTI